MKKKRKSIKKKVQKPTKKTAVTTQVHIPRKLIDFTPENSGYSVDMAAKFDTVEEFGALGAQDFSFHSHLDINESLWKDYATENDKYKTWAEDYRTHFTHQGNSHECVSHAFTQWFEITWNKQSGTKNHSVWFSPLSIYCEANPRQWGGTYLHKVLSIARNRGILPEHNGPEGSGSQKLKFQHTLHQTAGRNDDGNGKWVRFPNGMPSGWQETARHFKPLEVINLSSWKQIVCCLLNGIPVWVGRKGHSITYTFVAWSNGRIVAGYPDSYNVIRYDSVNNIKSAASGALALGNTTLPDDWNKPAGDEMI